jgi:hypothetical protein
MRTIAKILQAIGLAAVMIALIRGFNGDMWGELYFSVAGVIIFIGGRLLEKNILKRTSSTK